MIILSSEPFWKFTIASMLGLNWKSNYVDPMRILIDRFRHCNEINPFRTHFPRQFENK